MYAPKYIAYDYYFSLECKKVWEVSISFSCQEKRTQSRCQNNLNIMLKAATDGEVITTTKPQTQVASNVAVFDVCNPAIGYHTRYANYNQLSYPKSKVTSGAGVSVYTLQQTCFILDLIIIFTFRNINNPIEKNDAIHN